MERVLRLPVKERVALALSLGDEDLDLCSLERPDAGCGAFAPQSRPIARPQAVPLSTRRSAMSLLDRVHRLLADQQIGHALIGAAALAARGIARSTYDIDLLTVDGRVLQDSVWGDLARLGWWSKSAAVMQTIPWPESFDWRSLVNGQSM